MTYPSPFHTTVLYNGKPVFCTCSTNLTEGLASCTPLAVGIFCSTRELVTGLLDLWETSQQSQEQFHAQPSVTQLLSGEPSPRFDDVGHNVLRCRADTLGTNPNFTEGSQNI